ncbi:hypothetical protein GY45DRAFT_717928 [Cubamyces sp. BRFM 1775]|nr:hypothetical protein GY45DRAFT_717928 [Cubamyces sp. BRFM 1775]
MVIIRPARMKRRLGVIIQDNGVLIGRRRWEYPVSHAPEDSRDAVAGDGNGEPLSPAPGRRVGLRCHEMTMQCMGEQGVPNHRRLIYRFVPPSLFRDGPTCIPSLLLSRWLQLLFAAHLSSVSRLVSRLLFRSCSVGPITPYHACRLVSSLPRTSLQPSLDAPIFRRLNLARFRPLNFCYLVSTLRLHARCLLWTLVTLPRYARRTTQFSPSKLSDCACLLRSMLAIVMAAVLSFRRTALLRCTLFR